MLHMQSTAMIEHVSGLPSESHRLFKSSGDLVS